MTDYLSDMLTRIRNGQHVSKISIKQRKTKLCLSVLDILWKEGFIRGYNYNDENQNEVNILLKYYKNLPVIKKIETVSKPGKRIYSSSKILWHINNDLGIFILSTPKGVISDSQARKLNVGGEILCHIS
jgi:small subunit ribosomal protein S8